MDPSCILVVHLSRPGTTRAVSIAIHASSRAPSSAIAAARTHELVA